MTTTWQNNLFSFDEEQKEFAPAKVAKEKKVGKKTVSKKDLNRGCDFCPLNKVPGLHKIKNLDKLEGKDIMVWAQNPGSEENRKRMELVGPAGSFLWGHANAVGLKREDCDIQNVVRCWTVSVDPDTDQWTPRNPSKEEIHACSIYTEQALERVVGKTKVHIVFGQVAAKALLKGEYRKDQRTFYSEKLKAWVILTYHPSYFLRGAPRSKLQDFKEALATAMSKAKGETGKFAYIKSMDYRSSKGKDMDEEILKPILAKASQGYVVVVDIEDGTNELGENVITYVGFCWKKGVSRGVWLAHKDLRIGSEVIKKKIALLKRILEDPDIPKAMQNGVYDVWKLKKLLGIVVKGFVHDTYLSEYLRFSGRKSYGLETIADIRFREFAGYKGILDPYKDKETKFANMYTVPIAVEEMYNGADCDLTKRVQMSNKGKYNEALLQCMMRVAPVLARMENKGPWLDLEHHDVLNKWIPIRIEQLLKEIREITGDKDFNPNKPQSVAAFIYDKLKLGKHLDARWLEEWPRSTRKESMQLLADYHHFPKLIMNFRGLSKKKNTYMEGFRKSAEKHGGRVKTKWWLTGTITCRLRSGGEKGNKTVQGLVNLQNIHGDPAIENMLVSDLRWRELYNDWSKQNAGKKEGTV